MALENIATETNTRKMLANAIEVAWPAVLESFFVALAGMIDTMMVATIGSYAVAAVGLTAQPKFIGLTPFFAINTAVSALTARRKGEKNQRGANEVLLSALYMSMIVCIVVSILFVIFAEQILVVAGSNADTHEAATTYFRIIMGGTAFSMIQMLFNSAQRGTGNTRISMTTNLTSSVVNIIGNYVLIGGHLGFPAMGVTGAAIATVAGTVVAAVMCIVSVYKPESYISIPYILKEKVTAMKDAVKSITKLGSNMVVENLAMRVGFLATALIAARLGTDEFAAHNVGMQFLSLAFSFADGMQAAAVTLSGQSLGAGAKEQAKKYGNICQRIGLFISVILSLIFILGGRSIFRLFFQEDHILDMGVTICWFMTVIVLAQISQIIFGACLRAAGDVRYTLMASIISVTIIRTIVTILFTSVFHLGLTGIWLGILADQATRFVMMYVRFHQGKWVDLKI